jgi:asparagine synthase (glutamine-hydrolysing)
LPDQARYWPLGRKAILRRIGLRGLDPALFERPKSGFVLPFNRWIRCGLKDVMDQTLRDPQAIAPAGLDPAAVERLWRAFRDGATSMYWSRVWSVYVFIRWCHRNCVFR